MSQDFDLKMRHFYCKIRQSYYKLQLQNFVITKCIGTMAFKNVLPQLKGMVSSLVEKSDLLFY